MDTNFSVSMDDYMDGRLCNVYDSFTFSAFCLPMNIVNRIELAIRRAASQMKPDDARVFKLLADEMALVVHDTDEMKTLQQYRERFQ